jgi:sucrose phosphorylase
VRALTGGGRGQRSGVPLASTRSRGGLRDAGEVNRSAAPQLITYADRLAGDLPGVRRLLDDELRGVFGGVHLLPFFVPIDGADAGFDPIDHTTVDPRVGTWDDVAALAAGHDVMADLIVNHVSAQSAAFVDWLATGDASTHAPMFLTPERVFGHDPAAAEMAAIYRPRPTPPFTSFTFADGTSRLVWTTFTDNQVDIDVEHELGWGHLAGILDSFQRSGITLVRLDAVGYAIKRAGTSCFMLPETFAFIDRLTAACHDRGMRVLVEIHGHHLDQIAIAERVDLVYDFALPPLTLDALYRGDATALKRWIAMRPANAVTVLDTHDGIGIVDVGLDQRDPRRAGLLTPEQIHDLVESIHEHSGGTSRAATGAAASNLDLYQVNCTFYDALGRDDARYLAARTIQLLLPGIPQIYYVGLLAGTNDMGRLARTGVGRDVNRHHYSLAEIRDALERPVVQRLLDLLRWRATEPAFEGDFELVDSDDDVLAVRWSAPTSTITATVDVRTARVTLEV